MSRVLSEERGELGSLFMGYLSTSGENVPSQAGGFKFEKASKGLNTCSKGID
jgi:hypothetical protein